ncbi:MAG: toprim domain-containing protein [Burkholderiaceae bacterium]
MLYWRDSASPWRDLRDGAAMSCPVGPRRPIEDQEVCSPSDINKRALAARIWRGSQRLDGPALEYLRGRFCAIPPADSDLRYHRSLCLFGFSGPALVGRISDAVTNRGIGLHLTWLAHDGERWKRTERRYLGRKAGGVVRLWPDEAVTLGLSVAEGIETALAAAHIRTPVWACLDAGNLAALPVLAGIEALTIFADRDESGAGQRAALACAEKWTAARVEVTVIAASGVGQDVNDEVTGCAV